MQVKQSEALKVAVIGWLQQCRDLRVAGTPIQPDPFYKRNDLLTPAVVESVMALIAKTYERELTNYASYHATANNLAEGQKLIAPQFLSLPFGEQFAIVQGIDRIMKEHELPPTAQTQETAPPEEYWGC